MAPGFLIAWEIMSFGGAVMILSEKLAPDAGRPVLFMLGLLGGRRRRAGGRGSAAGGRRRTLLLSRRSAPPPAILASPTLAAVGVLLLIGFGAKLGLLPFYEWFPQPMAPAAARPAR